ncbi:hypothetical protein SAMN05216524_110143 [Mucilaginibacter sp. OK098]|nr:hypothetical protein SAMN05216524_110143 [Mucilaginibacter sp. OK098]
MATGLFTNNSLLTYFRQALGSKPTLAFDSPWLNHQMPGATYGLLTLI